jgi:DNA-binding transcriptional ArsR family regulator
MVGRKPTGMETENAEQLILSIIENNPGIQPSSLETILVRKEDKSQNGISRPRLYRILKSLQDQGLVEVEKEKGKKEARYYLKGRRPTIVRDSILAILMSSWFGNVKTHCGTLSI